MGRESSLMGAKRNPYPLLGDMLGLQQRDCSELEPTNLVSIVHTPKDGLQNSVRVISSSVEVRT